MTMTMTKFLLSSLVMSQSALLFLISVKIKSFTTKLMKWVNTLIEKTRMKFFLVEDKIDWFTLCQNIRFNFVSLSYKPVTINELTVRIILLHKYVTCLTHYHTPSLPSPPPQRKHMQIPINQSINHTGKYSSLTHFKFDTIKFRKEIWLNESKEHENGKSTRN